MMKTLEIEQKEFLVDVFYDAKNPYKLINVCCSGKGKYNLDMNAFTSSFFLAISPLKIGGKETVKMKLFSHKNGEVDFPNNWRPANIVEFVSASETYGDFDGWKNSFSLGIIGNKVFHRDGSWGIPALILNDQFRNGCVGYKLQDEILASGLKNEIVYVSKNPILILGVEDLECDQQIRQNNFFLQIDSQKFYFDKQSLINIDGSELEIIESDYDQKNAITCSHFVDREIDLPEFIARRLTCNYRFSKSFLRICFDANENKRLTAFFD